MAISATTVLAPERVLSAPAPGANGTLLYRGHPPVKRGEFIALDVGDATPLGLLARVTAVRASGEQTSVAVAPASLIDVIPEGDIVVEGTAGKASRARAAATREDFESALSCSGSASASISGSLRVDLQPTFKLRWSRFRVRGAEASATLTGSAELSAGVDARGSCSLAPTEVARWTAPAIRFSVGPIPVVLVPVTRFSVSASGEVSGEVRSGVAGSVSATAGLRYENGQVSPIAGFSHRFSVTPPTTRLDAALEARVIPSVTFLLYGLAGPRFDLSTGLRLDAGVQRQPRWTLSAPIDLTAELEVPHFKQFSVGPRKVYSTRLVLATADRAPTPDGQPEPGEGERARIVWDTDDTDVDLHVWDTATGEHAWYSEQDGITDGELSSDITSGFGPEWFTDFEAPSTRSLAYGICYYDDNGHGATDVSVRIIDPDGTTRSSHHIVYATNDHLYLGSSPPGSGFEPDPGWCRDVP